MLEFFEPGKRKIILKKLKGKLMFKLSKKYRKGFIFYLCLMLLLLSGCKAQQGDGEKEASSEESAPQEIRVALSMDPGFDALDNKDTSSNTLIQAHNMVYEGLVSYGEKGKIEPALAEKWEISEDGKEYTFFLRKGVKFTDGTPFNAQAVVFSFERWTKDPAFGGINIAKLLEKMEVIDEYTIKFVFKENYYPLLTEFTYPRPVRIMSPSSVEPAGDINGTFVKAIGTGRWKIDSYTKNQEAILASNNEHWSGKGSLEKIIFKIIPDAQTRIFAMKNGEIDLTGGVLSRVSLDSLHSIGEDSNISVLRGESTTSYLMIMNDENKFLKDENIRKAINHAINKQTIVKNLMDEYGKPAKALFQDQVPYVTEENSKWYDFDMKKAEEYLAQSGYSQKNAEAYFEKDGEMIEFDLVFSDKEYTEWKVMAEYIQSSLKDLGIKVNLKKLETNAYYDALWDNRDFDLIIYRTYSDSWNPHGFLLSLFRSGENKKAIAWTDEGLDKLIDEVIVSGEEDRQKKYDALYEYMYEKAMYVPLYFPEEIFLKSERVENLDFAYDSYYPFFWENIKVK